VDETKQQYFHQLQFMPSRKGHDSPFCPTKIPGDNRCPWSRWAEHQYDQYIMQEELEIERKKAETILRESVNQMKIFTSREPDSAVGGGQRQKTNTVRSLRQLRSYTCNVSHDSKPRFGKSKRQKVVLRRKAKVAKTGVDMMDDVGLVDLKQEDLRLMEDLSIDDIHGNSVGSVQDDEDDDDSLNSDDGDDIDQQAESERTSRIFDELTKGRSWADIDPNEPLSPHNDRPVFTSLFGSPMGTVGLHPLHKTLLQTSPPRSPTQIRFNTDFDPHLVFGDHLKPPSLKLVINPIEEDGDVE
jgi:hypothetical protein